MIRWDLDGNGHPVVKQEFKQPVCYLDHWAIRLFAADDNLARRLISALKARQGTWAVSLLNLMEFISITDEVQAAQFENLLDQALPNLFFIDFQAFDVIDRERVMLQGGSRNAPYGDVSLLSVFAHNRPDTPRPFTAKSLVTSIVNNRDRLAPGLDQFKDTVVTRIQLMRDQMYADKSLAKRIKGSQKSAQAQRTWLFMRELIGTVLSDRSKILTPQDAMDLFHSVVPIAYCDFVLLDSQWTHRVEVIRKRLVEHNIAMQPAVVFSKKRNGIEFASGKNADFGYPLRLPRDYRS